MNRPPNPGPADGPPDVAAQLAAMAAQYERLERAVRRAEHETAAHRADQQAVAARIKQAENDNTQLRAALDQANTQIKALTESVKARRARSGPPPLSWLDPQGTPPGPSPAAVLKDLAAWLQRVYVRLPGSRLPACWAWHPGIVDILLALRMAHAEVYSARGSWEKVAAWHLRTRPDTAKLISAAIGTCEIREHAVGGPLHEGKDPEVPLAGFLGEVAAVWADRRETPDPTQLVIAAAERYERKQRESAA